MHSMHLKLWWIWQQRTNFTQFFTQRNGESNENGNWHTQLVQSKFNIGTPRLISFLTADWLLGSMCTGFAEPNNPLASISADQWLKFCDDMLSVATPSQWIIRRIWIRTIWWPVFQLRHRSAEMHAMDCWPQLSQDTLNRAINQLLKRLTMVIKARGAHIEFRLY